MIVIGLMSGTSVDGIDAALVDISGTDLDINIKLLAGATYPYPAELRDKILAVCGGAAISMADLAELDDAIALAFTQSAQKIQIIPATLIGSHGQTLYHRPPSSHLGYTLQLGRGAVIAQMTGITTVSNFRVADIVAGGQGAPLVPRVDAYLLNHPQEARCVQNIGGIGNVTYIPPREGNWLDEVRGWDTGPGNSLLDLAVQHLTNGAETYDQDGNWAASGTYCEPLVAEWLKNDYFQQSPPKSTGRELFGETYLQACLADAQRWQLNPADFLASLTELTAASIVHSYQTFLPHLPDRVFLCGGGGRNLYLKKRIQALLPSVPVLTTDEVGLSADFKEAIAFAVLGYWRKMGITGNLSQVTGASQSVLLGEIYLPNGTIAI